MALRNERCDEEMNDDAKQKPACLLGCGPRLTPLRRSTKATHLTQNESMFKDFALLLLEYLPRGTP